MGKTESTEKHFGPGIVYKVAESLQISHCMVFWLFLQQSITYSESSWEGLYGIGNAQSYKKRMPEIPVDKKMKRVDSE